MQDYETKYYSEMPPEVTWLVDLRNDGWEKRREGDLDGALVDLKRSAEGLASLFPVHSEGRDSAFDPVYAREAFASHGQAAIAYCHAGRWPASHIMAWRATVYGSVLEQGEVAVTGSSGELNRLWLDQYMVIFAGRMSLVLSTSCNKSERAVGSSWASLAESISTFSENLDVVRFPDNDMDPDQRAETVVKFGKTAKAAKLANSRGIPTMVRKRIAHAVCSK